MIPKGVPPTIVQPYPTPPEESSPGEPAHAAATGTPRDRQSTAPHARSHNQQHHDEVVITIASEQEVPRPLFRRSRSDTRAPSEASSSDSSVSSRRSSWMRLLPGNFDVSRIFRGDEEARERKQRTYKSDRLPDAPPASSVAASLPVATPNAPPRRRAGSYYREAGEHPPLPRVRIEEMLVHSAVANSAYYDFRLEMLRAERIVKNNPALVQTAWKLFDLPVGMQKALGLERFPDGRWHHRRSHLVALILRNDESKQIVIAFGGTSAGRNTGKLVYRILRNPLTTFHQWRRNLHSIGLPVHRPAVPDCYVKAAEIARSVRRYLDNDWSNFYADYTLSLAGHSKGGAEAEYAALMNPSLRAVCFSTPPLGKRVLASVPETNLAQASDNILHYFVRHDVVPGISSALKRVLVTSHVGTGKWIPAPEDVVAGPLYLLWAHDLFHDCVLDYASRHLPGETDGAGGHPGRRQLPET